MPLASTAPRLMKNRRALVFARLVAQGIVGPTATSPRDVVSFMGAMQGQDLPGVLSSLALRMAQGEAGEREGAVRDAFSAGEIVRGYPMRGTVFALAGADARWITELCAKPHEWEAPQRRGDLGIEQRHVEIALAEAERRLSEAPRGLSRSALFASWRTAWEAAGALSPGGPEEALVARWGYHLSTYFIAQGHLIYGPLEGTDNALCLASSWLPAGSSLEERFNGDRAAAVGRLLATYLTSHGPATLRDFAWWTKLPLRDIRAGFALIESEVEQWGSDAAGEPLYSRPGLADECLAHAGHASDTHLLPGFDELVLGYPDRLALLTEDQHRTLCPGNNGVFMKPVVKRGQIVGTWRNPKKGAARPLVLEPFAPLPASHVKEAERVYARYPLFA